MKNNIFTKLSLETIRSLRYTNRVNSFLQNVLSDLQKNIRWKKLSTSLKSLKTFPLLMNIEINAAEKNEWPIKN